MKNLIILCGLITAMLWSVEPSFAESERHSPSRPYFDSAEVEIHSLLSLSFVSEMFLTKGQGFYFGPEDEPYFTPEDMKTIKNDWQMYIRNVVNKILEALRNQGLDLESFTSVYDLLAAFFAGCDLNGDGNFTQDEKRGMIIRVLPWGITRALVLEHLTKRPKDEMIPKLLQDLKEELSPDGGLQKIIRELCEAGVLTGKLCELPLLPECPMNQGEGVHFEGRETKVELDCGIAFLRQ